MLPVTWKPRGHRSVINWPNFKTVVHVLLDLCLNTCFWVIANVIVFCICIRIVYCIPCVLCYYLEIQLVLCVYFVSCDFAKFIKIFFFLRILGIFCVDNHVICKYRDSFISSFLNSLPFISFSCLVSLTTTSSSRLSKNGENGCLSLFLILGGKHLVFLHEV